MVWLGSALAGCGLPAKLSRNIGTGETVAVWGLEGRWAGPVRSADAACGKESTGLMSVGSGAFAFDPFQGTTVLKGTVEQGKFRGELTRRGGGNQTLSIVFEGEAARNEKRDEVITGKLSSGRCQWNVTLKRA